MAGWIPNASKRAAPSRPRPRRSSGCSATLGILARTVARRAVPDRRPAALLLLVGVELGPAVVAPAHPLQAQLGRALGLRVVVVVGDDLLGHRLAARADLVPGRLAQQRPA